MEFFIFLLIFLISFSFGFPIAFSMMFSAIFYGVMTGKDLRFFSLEAFSSLDNFILIAIPMFLLTAEVMMSSSIAKRLFNFANSFFGFIPGGLGHVNVATSIIFAGMSGSAMADAGGIGYLSYKSMVGRGFDKPFSAALTASSAMIGPIVPPSIPMIIYAMVASESIGKLFLGGFIPGIMMGLSMMVVVYFTARRRNYPIEKRLSAKKFYVSIKEGLFPTLTPIILLGTISFGMVTVTEGAIITVLYACLISGLLYHELGWKKFVDSLKNVFKSTSMVLTLFIGMKLFGYVLAVEEIPVKFSNALLSITNNPVMLIIIINLIFIILGTMSDATVNIVLFVPIVLPLLPQIGIDPIQFGVMIVLNAMIGVITPPFGVMVFFTSAITKVPISEIIRESWPFIGILLIVLILIIVFPPLVTFLPGLFM